MTLEAGIHKFGPDSATLAIRTKRGGAAAKAGHDLLIHVTSWQATLQLGATPADSTLSLDADGSSLHVQEGTGGLQSLGEDDKASIRTTIDDEVLKRADVKFRSSEVESVDGRIKLQGELELMGVAHPISFELTDDGGRLAGSATVTQSMWGIKPYSALFGALKVLDDVEVSIDAPLPAR